MYIHLFPILYEVHNGLLNHLLNFLTELSHCTPLHIEINMGSIVLTLCHWGPNTSMYVQSTHRYICFFLFRLFQLAICGLKIHRLISSGCIYRL